MTTATQLAVRWEPIDNIPDSPFADFDLQTFGQGRLRVLVRYSGVTGNPHDLLLEFTDARGFRSFWDGDGDGPLDNEPPRCSGANQRFIWPLLTLERSRWLDGGQFATSQAVAAALGEEPWRHYRVIALERSLDVIARGAIRADWVSASD